MSVLDANQVHSTFDQWHSNECNGNRGKPTGRVPGLVQCKLIILAFSGPLNCVGKRVEEAVSVASIARITETSRLARQLAEFVCMNNQR